MGTARGGSRTCCKLIQERCGRVEIRQIQYFICLFEEGSMTAAARRMHIVQPALSAQIAKLEAELEQTLFIRHRKGMTPTEAGRRMYQLYRPILDDLIQAREDMMVQPSGLSGNVRIGMISSLMETILSGVLIAFSQRHPQVHINVTNGPLLDWLTEQRIELAIMDKPPGRFGLHIEPLFDEPLVLVGPASSALPPGPVALQTISRLPLILTGPQHGVRIIIDNALAGSGILLQPNLEVDSMPAILSVLAEAKLYSLLPTLLAEQVRDHEQYRIWPLHGPTISRQTSLIHHPKFPLSPAASAFAALVREHTSHLISK